MAESQVPFPYTGLNLKALRASLSEPRFATYLKKGGQHEQYALALYLYNARVAKALLFPLHVVEVTLRNAVDEVLVHAFGPNWHTNPGFQIGTLMPQGLPPLNKAIARAGQNAPRDQVVATLSFDFWSNLFRREYGNLWRTSVNVAFPNLKHGESRSHIQSLVRPINDFRNRVAHYEPILDFNVTDIQAKIVQLTELRCGKTAEWLRHHSTIGSVVRTRPKLDGSVANSLALKMDTQFQRVGRTTPIMEVLDAIDEKPRAIICIDDQGRPEAAFTTLDVARFVSIGAKKLDGLMALGDYEVSDLLAGIDIGPRWAVLPDTVALALAVKELQKPRIQV